MYFHVFVPINKTITEFKKNNFIKKEWKGIVNLQIGSKKNFIYNYKNVANKSFDFCSVSNRILCELSYTTNTCGGYYRHLNSNINQKIGE